jgi:hypothetical protein
MLAAEVLFKLIARPHNAVFVRGRTMVTKRARKVIMGMVILGVRVDQPWDQPFARRGPAVLAAATSGPGGGSRFPRTWRRYQRRKWGEKPEENVKENISEICQVQGHL